MQRGALRRSPAQLDFQNCDLESVIGQLEAEPGLAYDAQICAVFQNAETAAARLHRRFGWKPAAPGQKTPLMVAASLNNAALVREFIEEVGLRDDAGMTALTHAVFAGAKDCAALLRPFEENARDSSGRSAADYERMFRFKCGDK